MTHLTEELLNEYLDGELEPFAREAVEAHLAGCPACREELEALRGVGTLLETLPEAAPARDLAPALSRRLKNRPLGLAWKLVLGIEAGIVLGLLTLLAPRTTDRLVESVPGLADRALAAALRMAPRMVLPQAQPDLRLPGWPVVRLPALPLGGNPGTWLALGIAAGLLFIVGNLSLIFCNHTGALK